MSLVSLQIARLREEGSRLLQEEQRLIREQIQQEKEERKEQEHRGARYTHAGRLHHRQLQVLTVRPATSNPVKLFLSALAPW